MKTIQAQKKTKPDENPSQFTIALLKCELIAIDCLLIR